MKFFTTSQIRQLDEYTIANEPIESIDLMERAANALYLSFIEIFSIQRPVCIVAGQGNNGGDALAVARMLLHSGYPVNVLLVHNGSLSPDCDTNRLRLISAVPLSLTELTDKFEIPQTTDDTIIIDGLFGSGLSRPLSGIYADAVRWINHSGLKVVSIDIPSGLSGEENKLTENSLIVKANFTFSLQFPKLAFLLAENALYTGNWKVIEIGIHPKAIALTSGYLFYLDRNDIAGLLKDRPIFSHKGTYGHLLIVAGTKGMAGASVLSSKAALRSGAGLVTVHGPAANRVIVQTANPEVIFQSDTNDELISEVDSVEKYSSVAIGPGIGTHSETSHMLDSFIAKLNKPCVFDADALNIISRHKELLSQLPRNSILTPHPKEFERIFGKSDSSYERILKAKQASIEYGLIIILKGAHTSISTPDGNLFFNSTGNSGMATAGSGDVLTGVLVGLLAQGYTAEDAAKTGVFIHGLAGDLALTKESKESLIAGDIIENLGLSFRSIQKQNKNLYI